MEPTRTELAADGRPAAEAEIDAALVGGLLTAQHPDLARLPLRSIDAGWDNAMFRLGDELAVRLPRRASAAALITHEQAWLPSLAPSLPLPVPAPLRIGRPGAGYPWPWSVVPWLAGAAADLEAPSNSQAQAFGRFLGALHVAAPAAAPRNRYRGVPLAERDQAFHVRTDDVRARGELIDDVIEHLWRRALQAPVDVDATWIHGDLHPRNVLVEGGLLSAVIDWGDMAAGDRAADLASIWMLFGSAPARHAAMHACGEVTDATWLRARGWAVYFGVTFVDAGQRGDPRLLRMGRQCLRRLAQARDA